MVKTGLNSTAFSDFLESGAKLGTNSIEEMKDVMTH
jgi:hypothetical protein